MREDRGRIVLMDFGTGRDGAQLATAGAGDLVGTPLYMAPEVLAGAAAPRCRATSTASASCSITC